MISIWFSGTIGQKHVSKNAPEIVQLKYYDSGQEAENYTASIISMYQLASPVTEWRKGEAASARRRWKGFPRRWKGYAYHPRGMTRMENQLVNYKEKDRFCMLTASYDKWGKSSCTAGQLRSYPPHTRHLQKGTLTPGGVTPGELSTLESLSVVASVFRYSDTSLRCKHSKHSWHKIFF